MQQPLQISIGPVPSFNGATHCWCDIAHLIVLHRLASRSLPICCDSSVAAYRKWYVVQGDHSLETQPQRHSKLRSWPLLVRFCLIGCFTQKILRANLAQDSSRGRHEGFLELQAS